MTMRELLKGGISFVEEEVYRTQFLRELNLVGDN